jgi:hypothetical protein
MTSSCRYYFICDPHENVSSAYSLYYTASLVGVIVQYIVGMSPGRVKPVTIKLVLVPFHAILRSTNIYCLARNRDDVARHVYTWTVVSVN